MTLTQKYREQASYDKAGNILSIQRTDGNGDSLHNLNMAYTDGWNGYTLISVNGGPAFQYDWNVNMIKDGMTGVQIEYNILDLPQRIYKGSDQISYI